MGKEGVNCVALWGRKELTVLHYEEGRSKEVNLYIRLHNRVNLYIGQGRIKLHITFS